MSKPKCVISASINCCNPDGVAEAARRHNVAIVYVDNKKPGDLSSEDKADIARRDGVTYSFSVPVEKMATARNIVETIVQDAMAADKHLIIIGAHAILPDGCEQYLGQTARVIEEMPAGDLRVEVEGRELLLSPWEVN